MALKLILLVSCGISLVLGGNLLEEAQRLGATTVIDLLKQAGLDQSLTNDYLTLFIPTNEAFANIPDDVSKTLASNVSILAGVLSFHASSGIFRAQDAVDDMLIKTELPGSSIRVNTYDDENNAVYITLNGAKVLQANIMATNGIVHLIDRVMYPPMGNFYELISASGVHKTLKQIIDATGFQSFFETSTGTVFAPTDAAFEEILAPIRAAGYTPDFTSLESRETTMYHMLPNVVYSSGAKNDSYITNDKGEKLTVTMLANGGALINNANVIIADIPATNGVIHFIDKVLRPAAYAPAPVVG